MANAWESAPLADSAAQGQPAWMSAPVEPPQTFAGRLKDEALTSLPGGVARGVKDVIDTLAGFAARTGGADEAARVKAENEAGKAEFAAAQERAGAGGSNIARVGGQVLATAPIGGAIAAPVKALGATRLGNAIASGGFRTGAPAATTLAGKAADMGIRMAGGAVTGGAAAGAIDPDSAGTGAAIGAALPPTVKALGAAAKAAGRTITGPSLPENLRGGVESARKAGYVIPPTQAKPSLANRLVEGMSGKITTAQNASARNQPVTDALAKKALGLADDAPLSVDALASVRKQAGVAYDAVANSGSITPGKSYTDALDAIQAPYIKAASGFPNAKANPIIAEVDALRSPEFDASSAIAKISELREATDKLYRSGDTAGGKAMRSAAAALENAIEVHLKAQGAPEVLKNFRDARTLIAKTYSVQQGLNDATGSIDAGKLAGLLRKGKPLSGELRQIAEFAAQFPKAAQTVERMGSLPQWSPLDLAVSGGVSMGTGNPAMMAGMLARPAARSIALSSLVQNNLSRAPSANSKALAAMLADPALQQLAYRTAPVAATRR